VPQISVSKLLYCSPTIVSPNKSADIPQLLTAYPCFFSQDDTHVLIDPAYLNYLKDEVMRLFDQNTFERRD
jgi:hypothetical protein